MTMENKTESVRTEAGVRVYIPHCEIEVRIGNKWATLVNATIVDGYPIYDCRLEEVKSGKKFSQQSTDIEAIIAQLKEFTKTLNSDLAEPRWVCRADAIYQVKKQYKVIGSDDVIVLYHTLRVLDSNLVSSLKWIIHFAFLTRFMTIAVENNFEGHYNED